MVKRWASFARKSGGTDGVSKVPPESVKPAVVRGPDALGSQRRRQIVATAAAVFAQLGYNGGSIRTIADRV